MSSNQVAENASLAELEARVADLERRLADSERLREQASRYRTILEAATVGVTFLRIGDRSFLEFNDAAAHNLGYTREEFARLTIDDIRVPPDPDRFPRLSETFETRVRAKNGTVRDFVVSTCPFTIDGDLILCAISRDITERKQVERQLWQQQSVVQAITTVEADAILMMDGEHRVIFANPAAERTFGFTFDELRGRGKHAMIHHKRPDGTPYPVSECPLSRVHETGIALLDHRDLFFHKDGSPIYVSVSHAPLIRNGKVTAVIAVVRDITEAELSRRRLTETNERLASALATAELGVWNANFVTGEMAWDAQMKSLLCLAPDEPMTVAKAMEFIHPQDRALSDEILNLRPEPNGDVRWEWRVILRDGSIRWHQSRGHFARDRAGRAVSAHGVTRDITDQKLAQEVRERLAAIVESTEDAIASCTPDGIITSWNHGAEAIFGYTAEEIVGRSAASLFPPELLPEMATLLSRMASGESVARYESVRLTKDGRRVLVSMTLSPMRNEAGRLTGISGVLRDITREKLLEEKLRQAEKMEAIGQLAGGIAHDFNNLLTIVNGYAGMALIDATDDLLRDQLAAIKAAGQRATALTSQLLAFSRKQMLELRIMDVNSVVEAMLPLLRRVTREDIECAVDLDRTISSVKADPHQIEQVLLNLVVNASDAMDSGGRILIETRSAFLDDGYTEAHPDAAPGSYVMLAVSDTGPGIEPGIQAQIFEPFFTTKPVGKSTGLGLSTVYGIARQSGGHVTCYSEPGAGATFSVYLPVVHHAVAPNYPSEEPEPESVRGTETILLVENDADIRAYSAGVLRGLGYSVHEAAGGTEASGLPRPAGKPSTC